MELLLELSVAAVVTSSKAEQIMPRLAVADPTASAQILLSQQSPAVPTILLAPMMTLLPSAAATSISSRMVPGFRRLPAALATKFIPGLPDPPSAEAPTTIF